MSRISLAGNFLNNNKTNTKSLVFDTIEMDCKLACFFFASIDDLWLQKRILNSVEVEPTYHKFYLLHEAT